jgi:hypothetical protein
MGANEYAQKTSRMRQRIECFMTRSYRVSAAGHNLLFLHCCRSVYASRNALERIALCIHTLRNHSALASASSGLELRAIVKL